MCTIPRGVCPAQAKNPSRDLPIAILGSLSVATILYILMALAITMMVGMHRIHLDTMAIWMATPMWLR